MAVHASRVLNLYAANDPRCVTRKPASPFRYLNSSPEVIRLAVLLYVKYRLSLGNVEDSSSLADLSAAKGQHLVLTDHKRP